MKEFKDIKLKDAVKLNVDTANKYMVDELYKLQNRVIEIAEYVMSKNNEEIKIDANIKSENGKIIGEFNIEGIYNDKDKIGKYDVTGDITNERYPKLNVIKDETDKLLKVRVESDIKCEGGIIDVKSKSDEI